MTGYRVGRGQGGQEVGTQGTYTGQERTGSRKLLRTGDFRGKGKDPIKD